VCIYIGIVYRIFVAKNATHSSQSDTCLGSLSVVTTIRINLMCFLVTQGIKESTTFTALPVIFANKNAVNEANANAPLKSVEAEFYMSNF
jgi:hypothetical protein